MTTNHPAHGPVSLDRLHQIREILSKAAVQSDGGNLGYAMADAVKVIDEVLSVPATLPCPVHLEPGLKFGKGVRTQCMLDALRRRAVYYAELEAMTPEQRAEHDAGIAEFKAMLGTPAPVVPEWTNEQCLEFLSIAFRHAEIKGDLELDDIRLGMKMVNESRAAMLQDSNSPVTQDAYEIKSFGFFRATEGSDGLALQIEQFRFESGSIPKTRNESMVPKFALQAIINRLQEECDSMGCGPLIDILSPSAAPQQEDVK